MGETQMGRFGFASWTLHMASIIIFITGSGWYFREWQGASRRTHLVIGGGLGVLLLSTIAEARRQGAPIADQLGT